MTLEFFLLGCACGAACYGLVIWIKQAVPRPDPWGPEVEHALEELDPAPVCPHCLIPQEHNGWLCLKFSHSALILCKIHPRGLRTWRLSRIR